MSEKETSTTVSPNLPYSYHTFLFPFLWNVTGSVKENDFIDILSDANWTEEEIGRFVDKNPFECGCDPQEWRLKYAAYQYFTPAALNIIFDIDSKKNVRLFSYSKIKKNNKTGVSNAQYLIKKEDKNYSLAINAVRLKVYATGIAVLVIEAENYEHTSIDDVNAINEYGRRISLPFFPIINENTKTHAICADEISLKINNEIVACQNYLELLKKFSDDSQKNSAMDQAVSWNFAMSPLQFLLDNDGQNKAGKRISTNANKSDSFLIKPCIDDRMFVCCLVRDAALSEDLKRFDEEEGEYCYLTGSDPLSETIYKLLYVETGLTCHSTTMRKEILKRSVYDRWIDCGTIHGVTAHSIFCITSPDESLTASVINPFLTQAVEMAILSLTQRSHQLLLFDRISEISKDFANATEMEEKQFLDIENLQEFYVRCQDQVLLSEVTVQEQGIELYNMLQTQLLIPKNKAMIDAQMNNLRDVSNISHERSIRKADDELIEEERKSSLAFNWLAVVMSILAIAEPLLEFSKTFWISMTIIIIEVVIVVAFVFFLLHKRKNKEKNKQKK